LYILFQNDTLKHFGFETKFIKNKKFTNNTEQQRNMRLDRYLKYFELSIPIFSSDQQSAYVEVNKFCPECGCGFAFFVKKINGNWQIVQRTNTWQN